MPEVLVGYNGNVDKQAIVRLANALPGIVSEALSCTDWNGGLEPLDVEVRVREQGPMDVNTMEIEIRVIANWFPDRERNLQERTEAIEKEVLGLLPKGLVGLVWVLLCPAGFTIFET